MLDTLGPAIVTGEYPVGTVLRTEELETRFRVSRTVVREALRVLEAMHLVVGRRRVGIVVLPEAAWNLYDPRVIRWRLAGVDRERQFRSLTELRAAVEPAAAALAAVRVSAEQAGRLTSLAVRLRSSTDDLDAFLDFDIEFHRLLLVASGNEMFAHLGEVVGEVLTGRTRQGRMPMSPKPEAVRLHVEVAEAVVAGDAGRAEAAMRGIVCEVLAGFA
ncbi:DNA-binding FadR family transcriptional regulator [Actinokineospora auranticolor]|uniref:DNA-binding FadR family transcriptional regulator n=1 Tax=Actinokineospora auranticolor TaxID=155976 RepID=A0A2S6GDW0_9PSEU|nr:DNA-binding FadR family transcriptional regulator [Actinokineospora auranticolor]